MSIKQVSAGGTNHNLIASNVAYGTCATAAATAAKVITVSGGWELTAGAIVSVKFTYTNSASNPTFNVNSTGAKKVWYDTALITTGSLSYAGYANRIAQYMYDGTQYVFQGWSTDSNSDTKAASSNKTGTKLFLTGATAQSTSGQTIYSNSGCYVGADNCLYSNSTKVSVEGHSHSGMATVKTGTIPASGWSENDDTGVKSISVAISGVTASHTAKVDHSSASIDGTADGYATFVEEENQYLERITNGYAETYAGGIKFYIFGDAPTVVIPIVVEVV